MQLSCRTELPGNARSEVQHDKRSLGVCEVVMWYGVRHPVRFYRAHRAWRQYRLALALAVREREYQAAMRRHPAGGSEQ